MRGGKVAHPRHRHALPVKQVCRKGFRVRTVVHPVPHPLGQTDVGGVPALAPALVRYMPRHMAHDLEICGTLMLPLSSGGFSYFERRAFSSAISASFFSTSLVSRDTSDFSRSISSSSEARIPSMSLSIVSMVQKSPKKTEKTQKSGVRVIASRSAPGACGCNCGGWACRTSTLSR